MICKWGMLISNTLNCGFSSFTGWNMLLDEVGGPNIGPFFCGGLVTRNSVTGELSYSGQYKTFKHFAPFIKKGAKVRRCEILDDGIKYHQFSLNTKEKPLTVSCVQNDDGLVINVTNAGTEKRQIQLFLDNKWWYFEILPDSVNTVLFYE